MAEVRTRFSVEDNISDKLTRISQLIDKLTSSIYKLSSSIDNFANVGANNFARFQNVASKTFNKIQQVSDSSREKLLSDINKINSTPIKDKVLNVKTHIDTPSLDNLINYNKASSVYQPFNTKLDFKTPDLEPHKTFMSSLQNVYRNGVGNISGFLSKLGSIYFATRALLDAGQVFFEISDKVVNIDAKLNLITDTKGAKEQLKKELQNVSNNLGVNYLDFADNAIKMKMLTAETFKSNQELVRFNQLMQEMFRISGSTTDEAKSAMLQLTQALAANKLQGDEYRSMLRNAPMLIEAITKEMGVPRSELKRLSSEGKITAEVIKNAMFSMADDLDTKFKKLPKQWSQIGNIISNKLLMALQPVLVFLNKVGNSKVVMGIINAFGVLLQVIGMVIIGILTVADLFYNVLHPVGGVVLDIAIALGIVYGLLLLYVGAEKLAAIWTSISGAVVTAWGWAQAFLNGQLTITNVLLEGLVSGGVAAVSAINWIVAAIVAVLVAIRILQVWLIKAKNMYVTYVGALVGCFTALGACVVNTLIFIYNAMFTFCNLTMACTEGLLNGIASTIKVIFNAIAQVITNIVGMALKGLSTLLAKVDKVAGTNLAGKLGGVAVKLTNYRADFGFSHFGTKLIKSAGWKPYKHLKYLNVKNSFLKGVEWGNKGSEWLGKGIKNFFGYDDKGTDTPKNIADQLKNISGNVNKGVGQQLKNPNGGKLDKIENNTGKIAESTAEWKEDLKLLRNIASRESINEITRPILNVTVKAETNIHHKEDTEFSVENMINKLVDRLSTEVENGLLGVVNK